jgi:tetratricopeptide (TPR) repeat protein
VTSSKGPSLVGEIHADARRRRIRKIVAIIVAIVVLVILGIVAKLAFDRYRVSSWTTEAGQRLAALTPAELDAADEELDRALELAPGHAEALSMRALVRAHRAFFFGGDLEAASAAVEAAEADSFHTGVAKALTELTRGDLEASRAVLDGLPPVPEQSPVPHHPVWLAGVLASTDPLDREGMKSAAAALDESVGTATEWLVYRRTRDALRFGAGDRDAALEDVTAARTEYPLALGLAVDEALYHALRHESASGVESTVNQLLESSGDLLAFDVARAHLARGIARLHLGRPDEAIEDLEQAWTGAAGWDWSTRDPVIGALRWLGEPERARALLEKTPAPELAGSLYDAQLEIADADIVGTLETLAKLPQDHAEVAFLQALALVEQRRFTEARPWIDRARGFFSERPDLEVAHQRTVAALEEEGDPVKALDTLSEDHPSAPRVWTGLGEAYLAAETIKRAKKAFEEAVERESHPAEAHLQLAEMIDGDLHRAKKARAAILEQLEAAVEADPQFPRYREHLARHLLFIGRDTRALELMHEMADEAGVQPETLLALVAYEIRAAGKIDQARHDELSKLVDKAEEFGGNPVALARERARLDIALGTPESIAAGRARVEPLIGQNSKDVELRLVYIESLLAQGEVDAALENSRVGVRRARKVGNGRLYQMWARAEVARGKDRTAARLARDGWKRTRDEDLAAYVLLDAAHFSADLYIKEKKPDIAVRVGREVTFTLPNHPDAWALRAEVELKDKREDNGCESAGKGIALEPTSAAIHAAMGHCHAIMGRKSEAKAEYEKAIELATDAGEKAGYKKRMKGL